MECLGSGAMGTGPDSFPWVSALRLQFWERWLLKGHHCVPLRVIVLGQMRIDKARILLHRSQGLLEVSDRLTQGYKILVLFFEKGPTLYVICVPEFPEGSG